MAAKEDKNHNTLLVSHFLHINIIYRQGGSVCCHVSPKGVEICRLCAGSDKRKKASMRWTQRDIALGLSVVSMSQYTLLAGARNTVYASIAEGGKEAYPQ